MNRSALQIKYNDPGSGLFKDNTTKDISEADLRDFVTDIANMAFTFDDNKYNGIKGTSPGINTITALKAIVTVNNGVTPVGTCIAYRDTTDNVFRFYELVSGTDAESLPDVVRPTDFNAITNQKVWKTAPAGSALVDGNGTTFTGTAVDIGGVLTDTLLTGPNGISMEFGTSGGGVFGFDWTADQMLFTADQWFAASSDGNMGINLDIDTQEISLSTSGGTVRITPTEVDLGALPLLGYLNSGQVANNIDLSEKQGKYKQGGVQCRTTTALPANTATGTYSILTANANGAFPTVDGETVATGLAGSNSGGILVMDEADPKKFGVYQLTQTGSGGTPWILSRRLDFTAPNGLNSVIVNVEKGTRFKNTSWKQTTLSPVIGTDNLIFKPFGDNIIEDAVSGYYKIISTSGVLSTTSI